MGYKEMMDSFGNRRYERIEPEPLAKAPWWCRCSDHKEFELEYDRAFLASMGIVPDVWPLTAIFTDDTR